MVRYSNLQIPGGTPVNNNGNTFRSDTLERLLSEAKQNNELTVRGGKLALRSSMFDISANKHSYQENMAFATGYLMAKGYAIERIGTTSWEYVSITGKNIRAEIPFLKLNKRR